MQIYIMYILIIAFITIVQSGSLKKFHSRLQPVVPLVKTENGYVRGIQNQTVGLKKTYYAFRGIPFAEPPVGILRFESPVPAKSWNGTLDATTDKSLCVQSNDSNSIVGSEDCLFLNVYTPELPTQNSSLLPVMVYIFGGTFLFGNSTFATYGPDYLLEENIVFVSINYRLGVFGFSSTGDMVIPGNVGFKDQVLALKWVNDNISRFGGNNKKITIFGQSAGGVSVSLHLQSKLSKGLFQNAIMNSGTSLCLFALTRSARETIFDIGSSVGVNTSTSQSLVDGLKKIDYKKLYENAASIYIKRSLLDDPKAGLIYGPVMEPEHRGAFFAAKSYELLSKGEYSHVPTIIGYNSMEGSADLTLPIRTYFLKYDLNITLIPPIDLNLTSTVKKVIVGTKIKYYYFGLLAITFAKEIKTLQYISDDQFVRPIRQTVLQMSKYSPVYYYNFAYEGLLGAQPDRAVPGTVHGEELNYIFNRNHNSTESDRLVRSRMVRMWTNFVKYGNPTPNKDALLQNVIWSRAQSDVNHLAYLDINKTLEIKFSPQNESMIFWDDIYSQYGNPPYDTY